MPKMPGCTKKCGEMMGKIYYNNYVFRLMELYDGDIAIVDGQAYDGTTNEKLNLTGPMKARQMYPDEVEFSNGMCMVVESCFFFQNGLLEVEKSQIRTSNERYMDQFIWNEENYQVFLEKRKAKHEDDFADQTHAYFLVDPKVDSIRQAESIIQSSIYYKLGTLSKEKIASLLLGFQKPIFELQYMAEDVDRTGTFSLVTIDLLQEAREKEDEELLELLTGDRY